MILYPYLRITLLTQLCVTPSSRAIAIFRTPLLYKSTIRRRSMARRGLPDMYGRPNRFLADSPTVIKRLKHRGRDLHVRANYFCPRRRTQQMSMAAAEDRVRHSSLARFRRSFPRFLAAQQVVTAESLAGTSLATLYACCRLCGWVTNSVENPVESKIREVGGSGRVALFKRELTEMTRCGTHPQKDL